ncbi:glycosyltransferase [Qipengyuania aquimaris]|uniref:Glycosyltransferase n=1 Tax=Qipengyuania aquimaris TaxID=255984 RepID=A0A9Q3S0Q5_9SPHN|nr:glycosyltransferase [Qipengyuania aquimaris]MBY6218090.1 glycosyltransferase [Qipengyuania aquimaris]
MHTSLQTANGPSVLLTLTAAFHRWDGSLYLEDQTISGLKAWSDHFSRIVAASVCLETPPPPGWSSISASGLTDFPIELVELPNGYDWADYVKNRSAVSDRFLEIMRRCTYNLFAIGGWIGDWGMTGALTAQKYALPHGIWFDRVESQVILNSSGPGLRSRVLAQIKSAVVRFNERRLLKHADLALLHGRTVFEQLGPLTRNPHIVEDIHLTDDDRIEPKLFERKVKDAASGPLRVVYAGRATAMKGPLDWVEIIADAVRKGVDLRADWLGDGELLDDMKALALKLGVADHITFHGFIADRAVVLDVLRKAHVLLFCHMTDESPRILIEALHSATPLVGYADPFARTLVEENQAGLLSVRSDKSALTSAMMQLNANRKMLQGLITAAEASAKHLTRDEVFKHRSEIVKDELAANPLLTK